MVRQTTLSCAVLLIACGSKVDLGDATQPSGTKPTSSDPQSSSSSGALPADDATIVSNPVIKVSMNCARIAVTPGVLNVCGTTWGIAYSPDGKLLATTSDNQLRLWRLSDGALVREFAGSTGSGYTVAFSPDGRLLATSGSLYNVDTGALVRNFSGGDPVAFSSDGTLIATGDLVKVWRVSDGAFVTSLDAMAINMQFARAGSRLLTAGYLSLPSAEVWDIPSGERVLSLSPISDERSDAAFSPDGLEIASTGPDETPGGGQKDTIKIWDVATQSLVQTLTGHQRFVTHVLYVDQDHLVSNDWSGLVKRWSRQSSGRFADAGGWQTPGQSLGIAVSPDKRTLAVHTATGPGAEMGASVPEGFVFLSL